jgi:hypothetical protein
LLQIETGPSVADFMQGVRENRDQGAKTAAIIVGA